MEKMWKTKRGVYAALLMLVMILFINANPSRATSLVLKMSNNSAGGNDCSSIHNCLIADDQSLEFLLGSEIVSKKFVSPGSLKPDKPIPNCGTGKNYKCLPKPNQAHKDEHCTNKLYQNRNRAC